MIPNQDHLPKWALEAAGETHPGQVRDHNEDRHLIDPRLGLYVVCDGMGGHQAGEKASEMAVESIQRSLANRRPTGPVLTEELLAETLRTAHQAIREAASANLSYRGMGTTAVIAWAPGVREAAWVAHVGDSRAYLWRHGKLEQLTEDHTWLNRIRRAGALPANPAEWPNRHKLSQALGGSAPLAPDVSRLTLQAEDVLLLCSDGLTDMLDDEAIARQLATETGPHHIARALVSEANRQGGTDNITVVAIHVAGRSYPNRGG